MSAASTAPSGRFPTLVRLFSRIDPWLLVIIGVFLAVFIAFQLLGTYRLLFRTVHANDPVGYYAWVRSPLFDGDFQFENEYRILNQHAHPDLIQWVRPDAPKTKTGHTPNYFAIGSGLFWSPFLMAVHPFAAYLGGRPDGFSQPYHMAVYFAVTFYGLAGMLVLYYGLRTWFPNDVSAMAAIAAWAGSPVLFYTFPDVAWSHSTSMFAMCLFFLAWVRLRTRSGMWPWAVIGFTLGLAALVRWQNVTYAIVPAIDLLTRRKAYDTMRLAVCAAFTVIAFAPQMIGWWIVFGTPLTIPQGGEFVDWAHPDFGAVLFSDAYGLITWTPLCGIAIAGLAFAPRSLRVAFAAMAAGIAVQVYVNACVHEAGWTFGMRRMDNAVPVFACGLAALYVSLRRSWARRAAIVAGVLFVTWNFLFAQQFAGILDGVYIDRAFARLAKEQGMTVEQLYDANTLPDGTPFNAFEFEANHLFPRAGGATIEQFVWDKSLVVRMIGHRLLGWERPG